MSEGDLVDAEWHQQMSECFVARLFVFLEEQFVFFKDYWDKTIQMLKLVFCYFLQIYN